VACLAWRFIRNKLMNVSLQRADRQGRKVIDKGRALRNDCR
jgi:hypothetical protein